MKWTLIGLISAIAAGLGWLFWWHFATAQRIDQLREEIVRAGYPIHLKDIQQDNISDADNAYVDFEKWKEKIKAADIAVSGTAEKQPPFLSDKKLSEADIAELAAIMATHQTMIDELIQAANKKYLRIPVDNTQADSYLSNLLDRAQELRPISRILTANVRLKIAQGKPDEGLKNAIASLKWSQLVSQQPSLVNGLTATAMREMGLQQTAEVLYSGNVDVESLKLLETLLQSLNINQIWKNTIYSEIPVFIDVFQPKLPSLTRTFGLANSTEAKYLLTMQSLAEKPILKEGLFVPVLTNRDDAFDSMWINSLAPALEATQNSLVRSEAKIRCLLALIQWRRSGGTAKSIEELQLAGPLPKDPFDGTALKMQNTEFGPTIYTIGIDRKDDGGNQALLQSQKDIGLMALETRAKLEAENQED